MVVSALKYLMALETETIADLPLNLTDLFENEYALAFSPDKDTSFTICNQIFTLLLPDIHTLDDLEAMIISRSEHRQIVRVGDSHWELLRLRVADTGQLILLKNISFETVLLTQLRKKLEAQSRENALYTDIITGELPFGMMITDTDFNVLLINRTLKKLFHIPQRANLQKCYNYVKRIAPCEGCPHQKLLSGSSIAKKLFVQDDRKITAEAQWIEDKVLLFFRETTREIHLIQEIKGQQQTLREANRRIAEQNAILRSLSKINIEIARTRDLDSVLSLLMDSLKPFYLYKRGAIVLFNEFGKIEHAVFEDLFLEGEKKIILDSIGGSSPEGYRMLEMKSQEKRYGAIYLDSPDNEPEPTIMDLFFSQVISYLENLKLASRLEELAQTDALTGVSNRYYFEKKMTEEIDLSKRFGQPLSLILIDINGLKPVNDKIGHQAGDALIQETARLIRDNLSVYDGLFRFGGDEFVVLLSNCPSNQMQIMVDMLAEIQQNHNINFDGQAIPLRFSLGGSCSEATEYAELLKRADAAMYENKKRTYEQNKALNPTDR